LYSAHLIAPAVASIPHERMRSFNEGEMIGSMFGIGGNTDADGNGTMRLDFSAVSAYRPLISVIE